MRSLTFLDSQEAQQLEKNIRARIRLSFVGQAVCRDVRVHELKLQQDETRAMDDMRRNMNGDGKWFGVPRVRSVSHGPLAASAGPRVCMLDPSHLPSK